MKQRLALIFPYLCALVVTASLIWQNRDASLSLHKDPVCRMEVSAAITYEYGQTTYYFCTAHCRTQFSRHPESFIKSDRPPSDMHTMLGIPGWLYYGSVGLILALSFGVFEWRGQRRVRISGTRFDLLQSDLAQRVLMHPATRFASQFSVVALFILIIAAGLFGTQLPSKNIAPLLTWTVWWGGLILLILYAGKAWCYVCPWDAIAGWAEGLRLWGRKKEDMSLGLKWPKRLRNIWLATALFVGLTWIEIGFGVTMKPRATAWLALGMLGLAFVCAFLFERKAFCRYGCLVGRVSGLYAMFSPVEIRARDRDVCRSCRTRSCYKGNENGEPCPTFQYLGSMEQNTYCTSCMECLKSCEQNNVALRLRPWGEDLVTGLRHRTDEAYLALIMLSLTGFHGLTMTGAWRDALAYLQNLLNTGESLAFSLGMTGLIIAPVLVYALLVGISWLSSGVRSIPYSTYFIRYAYALLPIALFYHLAHNSEHLLMEGQKVLALASDPFGWEWNLFGTSNWQVPPLVDLSTLWIIQVFLVVIGHVYSLWTARRTAAGLFTDRRAALRSQVPMLAAMILFSTVSLWLLKQPMEMRTSAM